jgi:hypothetical protein
LPFFFAADLIVAVAVVGRNNPRVRACVRAFCARVKKSSALLEKAVDKQSERAVTDLRENCHLMQLAVLCGE